MRHATSILSLLVSLCLHAQVLIDRPIELVGGDPAQRQVLGLPPDTSAHAVMSATTEQSGLHRTAAVSLSGTTWQVTLGSITGGLTAGTSLMVTTPDPLAGPVELAVNGLPAVPVLMAPGTPLMGDTYPQSTMLAVVYDGTAFQVMNGRVNARRPCPTGMIAVNGEYCIEPNERPATNFFQAALACMSEDRRLCSWGELVAACLSASTLGLNNMVGNWEWTRDSANEDGSVRMVLQSSCQAAGTRVATDTTLPIVSRCCYSR
jgi:hypothetical protein